MKTIKMKLQTLFIFSMFFLACSKDALPEDTINFEVCNSDVTNAGKTYHKNGSTYLWAGADSTSHFDITGWSLDVCLLNDYGYNRETIAALTEPVYKPIQDAPDFYEADEKVILLKEENSVVKVYPYCLMQAHEVINERTSGEAIMVAYCYLADLAAVYTRFYCDKEFTFGVSGYTYGEEAIWGGLDGFVLWDRETESLWWPLINKGVSGRMQDVFLEKYDEDKWEDSTWGDVKANYPEALVLQRDYDWEPPVDWPKYETVECE